MPAPVTVPDNPLATLRKEHPRVVATAEDFVRLRQRATNDPQLAAAVASMLSRTHRVIDEPVSTYDIPDGKRLLWVSRQVVERAYLLAMAWRMTGEAPLRERLWAEMQAVAAFPDWNPSHFLDTGEMAHAVAVAYDWLYDDWTDAQRCAMREAIVRHAFDPAGKTLDAQNWWAVHVNNWNVVCNGGLATAAIALGEETPQWSSRIIREAVTNVPICLAHFAPDGGWPEGPAYWGYTLKYLVFMLSSLQAGLGTDFGLGDLPGLAHSGMFPVHLRGPTGGIFNYADCGESFSTRRSGDSAMIGFWLAHRYDRDDVISDVDLDAVNHPLALLWWRKPRTTPPLDAYFGGVEAVAMRSAWGDPNATFVAVQCGRNPVGHNQADLGSFVLDALGVRWAVDLGVDDYNLPGYFGAKRWEYYRLRTESHNTIVINPDATAGQTLDAGGQVTRFDADAHSPSVTMDLTPAYPGTESVARRIEMPARRQVVIEDQVRTATASTIWWFTHTRAAVNLADDGRSALLEQDGKRLRVTLESPDGAALQVMPARPLSTSPDPEGQNPNDGSTLLNAAHTGVVRVGDIPQWGNPDPAKAVRKLGLRLDRARDVVIRVSFTPLT